MSSDNGVYKLVHLADGVQGQEVAPEEVQLVTISSVRDQARVFESFCNEIVASTVFVNY